MNSIPATGFTSKTGFAKDERVLGQGWYTVRIGEMAARAEVNVQTIRFYEREGLLRNPARTPAGYRTYEQPDLDRVIFIRLCQGLGFTLREVRELIRLHRVSAASSPGTRMSPEAMREIVGLAEERIASIEGKIETLAKMRTDLLRVVSALSSSEAARCPASAPGAAKKAVARSM